MDDLFTTAEVAIITGLEQPAAQERFLAKQGIRVMRSKNTNKVILSKTAFAKWQLGDKIDSEPRLRGIK